MSEVPGAKVRGKVGEGMASPIWIAALKVPPQPDRALARWRVTIRPLGPVKATCADCSAVVLAPSSKLMSASAESAPGGIFGLEMPGSRRSLTHAAPRCARISLAATVTCAGHRLRPRDGAVDGVA